MSKKNLFILFVFIFYTNSFSQSLVDSTKNLSTFSGSIGITNNGFAIIPTFSLNSPATIINLSFKKNRLSFEPDIRLVPNASKGGMVWWLRYKLIDQKKFSMRIGAHPAFSFIRRSIIENQVKTDITEMLRFAAFELVPNYQILPNWGIGAMYLEGHGLQKHGPQTTRVLFLNSSISNIKIGGNFRFTAIPIVYFLNTDGFKGNYFTATGIISNTKSPFTLGTTINQTFTSNIPGNQDFMWNLTLSYHFSKTFKSIK